MQGDTATYSQTLSQVNIAVNVQLRNVTRIGETVEAAGLELSPTGHTEAAAGLSTHTQTHTQTWHLYNHLKS